MNISSICIISVPGFIRISIEPMVRNTAIGSLLPDSTSRREFISPFRVTFLVLRIENTAAASVEEIIEPTRNPHIKSILKIKETKKPTINAVRNTPTVDKDKAGRIILLVSVHLVSNPPEKRIKIKATIPTDCARFASSKYIPPGPSEPASIPTAINSRSVGTPMLSENFAIIRLIITSTEPDKIR